MPRDIDMVVQTLTRPDWVFLPPSPERVMQDEVHTDARAEIGRRGLPSDTPYAGWHTQSHAFDRTGLLTDAQRVYFGGDLERVRQHLVALEPLGFAVHGGRSSSEAFVVVKDAAPTAADPAQLPALRTRLRVLADPTLLRDVLVPLRDGEEELLHDVLRAPGLAHPEAAVRPDALAALHRRGLATADDVGAALPDWRAVFDDRAPELALTALEVDHPAAAGLVLELLGDRAAPSALLLAWGDPRALATTHDQAVRGTQGAIEAYLQLAAAHGAAPRDALVGLAEEIRADADPDTTARTSRLDAVVHLLPGAREAAVAQTDRYSTDGSGSPMAEQILDTVRDETLPAWLRAQVVTTQAALPLRLRRSLVRADWDVAAPVGGSPARVSDERAREVLDAWDDAANDACAAAGQALWPGFGVGHARSRVWAHETFAALEPWQVTALRTHLARTDASETELATCLELLLVTGHLDVADVAPLRKGWRRRLLVAPDPYSHARPAVVSFATALLRVGDPLADEVTRVVLADTRRWSSGTRHLFRAMADDPDVVSTLKDAAMRDEPGGREAALAWVVLDARASGDDVALAAARGWASASGPPWQRNRFVEVAIRLAEPYRPTWGSTHATSSVRQVSAALDLADDVRLPPDMRRQALAVAERSRVLRAPADVEPVAVEVEIATALRSRATAATRTLADA